MMIKYRIDDSAGIELVMLLSDAHPLYLPTITQERGIKVNITNWKKWILQLNSYIGNQVCCVCVCTCVHLCVCMCVCLLCMHLCARMCMYACVNMRVCTSVCTCIYVHFVSLISE